MVIQMSLKYAENTSEEGYYSASNGNVLSDPVFDFNQSLQHNYVDLNCEFNSPENVFNETFQPPINSSILESRFTLPSLYGKGILFDRIKEAQNTIQDLSLKLCCCENEIIILKQRKEAFETGYHELQKENDLILSDKIVKEELLKKVNNMGREVSELLKTHQNLVNKHVEQEQYLTVILTQKELVEETNDNLKDLNKELNLNSEEKHQEIEKLKEIEKNMSNRFLILKIEKDAIASEYDRVLKMFNMEERKCTDFENKNECLTKKLFESKSKFTETEQEALVLQNRNEFLQAGLKKIMEENISLKKSYTIEKTCAQKENAVVVRSNELLKEELILHQKNCNKIQNELNKAKQSSYKLKKNYDELKIHCEKLVSTNNSLDQKICEMNEIITKLKCEEKTFYKKYSTCESDKESSVFQLQEIKRTSAEQIKYFEWKISDLQQQSVRLKEDYESEKQQVIISHTSKIIELESAEQQLQENSEKLLIEKTVLKQQYTDSEQQLMSLQTEFSSKMLISEKEKREHEILYSDLSEKCCVLRKYVLKYKKQAADYLGVIDDTKDKYSELLGEKGRILNEIECLEKSIQILSKENNDLTKTNNKNLELVNQLNRQSKKELMSQREVKDEMINTLELSLEELNKKLQNTNSQYEQMKREKDVDLLSITNEHKSSLRKIFDEKQAMERQCKSLQRELSENSKQLECLSATNDEQKSYILELTSDLEKCKIDVVRSSSLKKENKTNKEVIEELSTSITTLTKDSNRLISERKDYSSHTNELLERLNNLIKDNEKQRSDFKKESQQHVVKEQKLKKDLYEISSKNENLKAELRQITIEKHSVCSEIDVIKSNQENVKKELGLLTELNKKLEDVNQSSREDNKKLRKVNEQLQVDMQTLKCSFEDLLAKELESQRSQHLVKENELLRKLSTSR